MAALLKNPLAYLTLSFCLFLVALPLISFGTTSGPRFLLWAGFAALCVGGLIPPVQRLLSVARHQSAAEAEKVDS